MRKAKRGLIFGVGVNDANYLVSIKEELPKGADGKRRRKTVFSCPFYRKWRHMIERCYSKDYSNEKIRSYENSRVCDEWLYFSNFRRWMESQDWEGNHLDKDLIIIGNKLYSPETCLMLEPKINLFIIDGGGIGRGDLPIGASYNKKDGLIYSNVKNTLTGKREYLGCFKTPMEAHLRWKEEKHRIASELAKTQSDHRVARALRERYAPDKDWSKY